VLPYLAVLHYIALILFVLALLKGAKSSKGTVPITGISLGMMAVLLIASFAVLQHIGSILFVAALPKGPNQVKALFLSLAYHLE
jgi:hypothetical protein